MMDCRLIFVITFPGHHGKPCILPQTTSPTENALPPSPVIRGEPTGEGRGVVRGGKSGIVSSELLLLEPDSLQPKKGQVCHKKCVEIYPIYI